MGSGLFLEAVLFNVVIFVALQKGNTGRVGVGLETVRGFSFDVSGLRTPWLFLKFPCVCQEGLPWTVASLLALMLADVSDYCTFKFSRNYIKDVMLIL